MMSHLDAVQAAQLPCPDPHFIQAEITQWFCYGVTALIVTDERYHGRRTGTREGNAT
jgi:hypothetical protein